MISDTRSNNRRIAKNTLLLYVRMIFLMIISLYTSRVILNALGASDFGTYNAVGGIVTMFSILSGSLSAAISRYITYGLGKGDTNKLNGVFSSSLTIMMALSAIIVVLIEIAGVWFLNCKMQIPSGRMSAANWVLQFSIVTFVLGLISVPYNALIIAHEKMSAFAYISIFEAVAKLFICYLILISPIDRLVFYAILVCSVQLIIRFVYAHYCSRHLEESKYHFIWDKELLKNMFSFAGWNFFGAGSQLLMTTGVNILMNLFFGVVANAARGIATQVENAVNQFVTNFTTALNPQITKSYAQENLDYMHKLVCAGAKYSYFLVFFLSLPILCETETILKLWLKNVPELTVIFTRLTLMIMLLSVLSNTLVTSMLATGNIKKYQIIVGGLGMTIFPTVYVLYKLGLPAYASYIVQFMIFIVQLLCRLFLLRDMIKLPISMYIKKVLTPVSGVSIISCIIPLVLLFTMEDTIVRFILEVLICTVLTGLSIIFVGLDSQERVMATQTAQKLFKKVGIVK